MGKNGKQNSSVQSENLANSKSGNTSPLAVAEFTSLKGEVLERSRFQHQLVSLNLIVVGTLLGIGLESVEFSSVLLVSPLITMFFAAGWAYHDYAISRIGLYIETSLENRTALGWEHFLDAFVSAQRSKLPGVLIFFHARGVFHSTQILMVVLALLETKLTSIETVLLSLDAAAIIFTYVLLRPSKIWNMKMGRCGRRKENTSKS